MKKLMFTTLLSVLTIGSSFAIPAQAATTAFEPIDTLTTSEETQSTQLDEFVPELSEASQEQQVAYNECYYEIYPDGSYFWICF